jgi:catechol 2,3-dioxygenase-like lactoylglutathione lyase family enzyme
MSQEQVSDTNIKQAVPFFGVADIERSIHFYVDGIGFKMTNHWIYKEQLRWCWLERDNAALMLQEYWKEGPHANLPADKLGVGVSICFICNDAIALYNEFKSKGIDASKPFVGNGMWVTSVRDPDGYDLQFESYTDVPEETEYIEQKTDTFSG